MSNNAGWIGVDLDGTLAHYDGWKGEEHIGEPVPLMLARVKQWLAEGRDVRIFTARIDAGVEFGITDVKQVAVQNAIEDWCKKHIGQYLKITCCKDYGMIELWDDRAVQVTPNWGTRVDGKA